MEFYDVKEIYFPNVCIICGQTTNNTIRRTKLGSYSYMTNSKNDYQFTLPICEKCNNYLKIKTGVFGKEGFKVLFFSILGLITSILVGYFTFSIFIGIAIFSLFFIFPYLNYRAKTQKKIRLDQFLKINIKKDLRNTIQMTFVNQNYADYINEINLKKYRDIDKSKELIKSTALALETKLSDFEIKDHEKSTDHKLIEKEKAIEIQNEKRVQDESIFELTLPKEEQIIQEKNSEQNNLSNNEKIKKQVDLLEKPVEKTEYSSEDVLDQKIEKEKMILTEIPKDDVFKLEVPKKIEDEGKKDNNNLDVNEESEKKK